MNYRTLKGFSKYEVSETGVVKNVKTNAIISGNPVRLYDDSGNRVSLTKEQILELQTEEPKAKAEKVVKEKVVKQKPVKEKKEGVIKSIELILKDASAAMLLEDIAKKLKQKFPAKQEKCMLRTVRAQLSGRKPRLESLGVKVKSELIDNKKAYKLA